MHLKVKMTEKPLEQILNEFKETLHSKEENAGNYQSGISRYYQRLTKAASSALRFVKNKAIDAGSLVKELYEEGAFGKLGKAGLAVGSVGIIAGLFALAGYRDNLYSVMNDYVTAGMVGGGLGIVSGAMQMIQELPHKNLSNPPKKSFSYYLSLSTALGIAGMAGGMLMNSVVGGYPANHPEDGPFMSGAFPGAVCVLASMIKMAVDMPRDKNEG